MFIEEIETAVRLRRQDRDTDVCACGHPRHMHHYLLAHPQIFNGPCFPECGCARFLLEARRVVNDTISDNTRLLEAGE